MAAKRKTKATKKPAKQAAPRAASKANTQSKALFLDHHLPKIARLRGVLATAQANLRNGYKAAKADGFMKSDFVIAFLLQKETGEKEMAARIAREATVAKWLGKPIAKQLDLFLSNQIDPEEAAYIAGQDASKNGKPSEPPLPAGEPAFDAYVRGFNDHQESLLTGMKGETSSGVPMTRSQFRAKQAAAAAKKKAAEYVDKQEEAALFTKRTPDEAA